METLKTEGAIQDLQQQFIQQSYVFVGAALPTALTEVAYQYLQMIAQNAQGTQGDALFPDTFALYGDPFMESIQLHLQPLIEQITERPLVPTYAYCRLYKYGDELHPHRDRPSCEYSITLSLGENLAEVRQHQPDYAWPIFLDGTAVTMQPGDMAIYKGHEVQHWRQAFEGKQQAQLFLHFVEQNLPYSDLIQFDSRPNLGLPSSTKDKAKLKFAEAVFQRHHQR